MVLGDRMDWWSYARTLIISISVVIICCDASDPPAIPLQPEAIREAEKELADAGRLGELYEFAVGGPAEGENYGSFARELSRRIRSDRIRLEENNVFVDSSSLPAPGVDEIQLTREELRHLFGFFTEIDIGQILGEREHPMEYVLKLLSAALSMLKDPFTSTVEMSRFQINVTTALDKSIIEHFGSFEKPEDIHPGLTKASLRAILDIYTGIDDKMGYLADRRYVVDEHDTSLVVYNSDRLRDSESFTVLFHLVRLCGVTELNIRGSKLMKSLSIEAQNSLAACYITRLVPPLDRYSCRNLYLMPDSDSGIQNRVWHSLDEVAWFSRRGDMLRGSEFNLIFAPGETSFLGARKLVRQAVTPEDFAVLEQLSIMNGFPKNCMKYLKQATNLRVFQVIRCNVVPPLDFLKDMANLESLSFQNSNLTVLPGKILAGLSKLSSLRIFRTQLKGLPSEVGQLEELEELILVGNLLLTSLPESLSNCPKLSRLTLIGSGLVSSLPSKLDSLRYLNISGNRYPGLLAAAMNYTGLEVLEAGNISIETLSDDFSNLKNLRVLNLRSNGISEMPAGISELTLLKELVLFDNQLSTLPPSMASLRYLHTLDLSSNRFQRMPSFAKTMKEQNNQLSLYLERNPWLCDDTDDELGLITLWDVFGECIMSEEEYQEKISLYLDENIGRYKEAFYDALRREPLHWNLEMLQELRLTVPPHSELEKVELEEIWMGIREDDKVKEVGGNQLIDVVKLFELIKVLYDPALTELRLYAISEANKPVMIDYLVAVTLNVQEKMITGETLRAISMISQLNDSLGNCPSGQAGALMEIYKSYCLNQDPENFETFVKESIAKEKDGRFTDAVALRNHAQNVHLVLHWKKRLGDELGLVLGFDDPYDRPGRDKFGNNPVAVLMAFFRQFSPENVVRALTRKLNSESKVGDVAGHLSRLELLPVDVREEYFELVEGVDDAAENFYFKAVKEAGVRSEGALGCHGHPGEESINSTSTLIFRRCRLVYCWRHGRRVIARVGCGFAERNAALHSCTSRSSRQSQLSQSCCLRKAGGITSPCRARVGEGELRLNVSGMVLIINMRRTHQSSRVFKCIRDTWRRLPGHHSAFAWLWPGLKPY